MVGGHRRLLLDQTYDNDHAREMVTHEGRARTHMNLNDPSTAGIVSALVIGVGPYVWNPSSEKIPRQQSGLKIRT